MSKFYLKKIHSIIVVFILTAICLTSCSNHKSSDEPRQAKEEQKEFKKGSTVALIDGAEVKFDELLFYAQKVLHTSFTTMDEEAKRDVVNRYCFSRWIAEVALVQGSFDKTELDIVMKGFETEVLYQELDDYLAEQVKVTDKDLDAYFTNFKESRAISNILVYSESEIKNVVNLLESGEDFGEIAVKYSKGPTASTRGFQGEITRDDFRYPSDILDEIFSAEKGSVIGPFSPLKSTFALVRVDQIINRDSYLAENKESVYKEIKELKIRVEKEAFRKKVLSEAKITFVDDGNRDTFDQKELDAGLIAVVNNEKIYNYGEKKAHLGQGGSVESIRSQAESYIEAFLMSKEAKRLELDKRPSYLLKKQAQMVTVLNPMFFSYLEKNIEVNDEVLRKYYSEYFNPRAYLIVLAVSKDKQKLNEIISDLEEGRDIQKIAAEYGPDVDIKPYGYEPLARFDVSVQKQIEKLAIKEISGVFSYRDRFAVIQFVTEKDFEIPDFDEIKMDVTKSFRANARKEIVENYSKEFEEKANVEILL